MIRGHDSCAAARRCTRRTRYDAAGTRGEAPGQRRAPASGPPNSASPTRAPPAASAAVTSANWRASTPARPACTSQSSTPAAARPPAVPWPGPGRAPASRTRRRCTGRRRPSLRTRPAAARSPWRSPALEQAPDVERRRRPGRAPPGPARRPSRPAAWSGPGRRNTSVTVKCVASAPPARSSTIATSVTRGPAAVRAHCTTTSMLSLTSEFSAASGSPPEVSASWQMNRSRVSAWRADPAWMVVYPVTPDDSVRSSGQRLAVAHLADHGHVGGHAQEAGDEPAEVDARPVGAGGAGLHLGHVRHGDVGLEHLLGHHDPQRRVELGRRARQQRRLARPRRPGEHDRQPRPHARGQQRGHLGGQHVALDQLAERAERDAGELADVDEHVAAAGDVAVHDVDPGAVVELGVLQALGRVEAAVGASTASSSSLVSVRRTWSSSWKTSSW